MADDALLGFLRSDLSQYGGSLYQSVAETAPVLTAEALRAAFESLMEQEHEDRKRNAEAARWWASLDLDYGAMTPEESQAASWAMSNSLMGSPIHPTDYERAQKAIERHRRDDRAVRAARLG